jgi:Spy/CpxP family protein refolding chaperone
VSKRKLIFLATAIPLLWGAVAIAQNADQSDGAKAPDEQTRQMGFQRGEWHKDRCADHYARKAARLAFLEAKLNLIDAQRGVWGKWQQSELDGAAKTRTACLENAPKPGASLTAVERDTLREKRLNAQMQELQASRPALQALYNALTPEQKTIFDTSHGEHFARHGGGHHWRYR